MGERRASHGEQCPSYSLCWAPCARRSAFDDSIHLAFGLAGDRFQVLYHFTIGGAVDDPRLQTAPPYALP